jgi:chromosome segregation ATPase
MSYNDLCDELGKVYEERDELEVALERSREELKDTQEARDYIYRELTARQDELADVEANVDYWKEKAEYWQRSWKYNAEQSDYWRRRACHAEDEGSQLLDKVEALQERVYEAEAAGYYTCKCDDVRQELQKRVAQLISDLADTCEARDIAQHQADCWEQNYRTAERRANKLVAELDEWEEMCHLAGKNARHYEDETKKLKNDVEWLVHALRELRHRMSYMNMTWVWEEVFRKYDLGRWL